MARAKAFSLVGIVTGLALTPAALEAAPVGVGLLSMVPVVVAPAQTPARPSRVSVTLANAIECHQRGEYETAATMLQQCQTGMSDLSPADQQKLSSWVQLNATALKARQDATALLRQVEQAQRDNPAKAAEMLTKILPNSDYLKAAEKNRFKQYCDAAQAKGFSVMPTGVSATPLALARAKLQQGRAMLAQGNFTAADALAREALKIQVNYPVNEDSPVKLMNDCTATQKDPKALLALAHAAMEHKDYEHAERLAQMSDKAASTFTFALASDCPTKLLKEIQNARGSKTVATTTPAKPAVESPKTEIIDKSEAARHLLKQGREAYKAGNLAMAQSCGEQARDMGADLKWWDDTPEKLLADVKHKETVQAAATSTPKDDPRALLKQARELTAAGRLEEAALVAQKAKASSNATKWGLFEDSPDRVLKEVESARVKRDQEESVKVMVDARGMFERGDLDGALKATFRAETLHGSYSILDLGDRPQKLRTEIEAAKLKVHKPTVPAVPGTEIAKIEKKTGPSLGSPVDDSHAAPATDNGHATVQSTAGNKGRAADNMKKQQAVLLLAEAKKLQQADRLIEARQKTLEAQRLNATFMPEEVSPEQMLLELAALAHQRIDSLTMLSNECMTKAASDAAQYTHAENNLQQARQLAVSFGQDTITLDGKLTVVKQMRAQPTASPLTPSGPTYAPLQPVAKVPNDGSPHARGMELLAQVDVALREGDTVKARHLAEEAFSGAFGVQAEATAKLRSIDAEEEGQRRLAACRTFDAGRSAFNRKDYAHACNILQTVDASKLDEARQTRLKEMMQGTELQPYRQTVAKAGYNTEATGPAKASDAQPDYLTQVQAMQEVKFQKLREDGLKAQRQSADCFKTGETDRALEILQDYLGGLNAAQLDNERLTLLKRPVEARLAQFKMMKGQRDQQTKLVQDRMDNLNSKAGSARAEENKKAEIAKLMKQYDVFFKEGKYREAEQQARLAFEMDPDNPMLGAAINIAKMSYNRDLNDKNKRQKADTTLGALDDTDDEGPYTPTVAYNAEAWKKASGRKEIGLSIVPHRSESEKQIERSMTSPVTLNFKDTPLSQVLQDLHQWQNVNIYVDDAALAEEGVGLDRPISMQLDQVALKSALKLVLDKVNLTFVIEDDVLKITSKAHAHSKMVTKVYSVGDLIIPVQDYGQKTASEMIGIVDKPSMPSQQPAGTAPYTGPGSLGSGSTVGSASGSQALPSSSVPIITKSSATNTMQEQLMSLIMNTIAPTSWAQSGGKGTIDYYPLTLSLTISQTPDIQEQVAELLAALRRLQDQEVAVEVRFISIAEGFYERIGVDFNINIPTGDATSSTGALLAGGNFTNGQFPNVFDPKRFLTGFTPAGTFTPDLDIPIKNSSFGMAIPPFGGFPNIPGANGGVSMGLAFLSDIQVFLFMEAAQGDTRTNVMQAPKITMFNGQTSTITVNDAQFFATNVTILTGPNGQPIFIPMSQPIVTGGSNLTIQSVISADRRFVRMSLTPTLTNLASAVVPLLPTTVVITPTFEGGFAAPPVAFTQFLQQPAFNTINVSTTVSVPDGGTVLLGGLKRLSEGRNEFGPPVLSKIPYINRLFKNVGYGREAESLLIMVTPRIIINEEEEIKATGVISSPSPE